MRLSTFQRKPVGIELTVFNHQSGIVDGCIADQLLVAAHDLGAGERIDCQTIDLTPGAPGPFSLPALADMSLYSCLRECFEAR